MGLLREKFVKQVVKLLGSPVITSEVHTDDELGVSFCKIFLNYGYIIDEEAFKRELSFILKEAEIDTVLTEMRIKLEDVFAKYIIDDDSNMAKEDSKKIADAYTQLIEYELKFHKKE